MLKKDQGGDNLIKTNLSYIMLPLTSDSSIRDHSNINYILIQITVLIKRVYNKLFI
jgi:hypothetical protein